MATVDDKKIIFSMVGVSKIIPQNQKQILKNIYLSFFYGAKIGIIGLNGAGKSTLMKIIAGIEQPTQGEVVFSPGYSVGYLPQDPPLNEEKTVKENVMEGVQHVYDALREYDEINVKFGQEEYYSDPDKMDKLMQRQAEVQDIIDSTDAWNMDSKLDRAMGSPPLPGRRLTRDQPVRRRAPSRGPLPTAAAEARRVTPRRADQPSGCRKHRLARTAPTAVRRHGDCRDSRPLFP